MKMAVYALLALPLVAQTDLTTAQLRPASPSSTPTIQFYLPGAGFVLVTLGTSLALNTSVSPPMLSAVAPPLPNFVDAETPGGTPNGTLVTFTLANSPAGSSLHLYRNGLRQRSGLDYTISGSSITFLAVAVPQLGDLLLADYRF
jgi:hypothetical protein